MSYLTPETDTLGVGIVKMAQVFDIPDYVMSCKRSDILSDSLKDIPSGAFADPLHREFPCHTKRATWLSCAYFANEYENIPKERRQKLQDNLVKHAEFFNILPEFESQLNLKADMLRKSADYAQAPDEYYLLVNNSSGERKGLLDTDGAVEKAAQWLVSSRNDLTLEKSAELAGRILKRADDLGTKLEYRDRLERMCGIGLCDKASIVRAIGARASLCKDAAIADQFRKLADHIKRSDTLSVDNDMFKVASAIDEADVVSGLVAARRRGEVPLPEELIYKHASCELEKIASETVRLQTGEVYSLSKLASIDRLDFESELGSDLAEEVYNDMQLSEENAASILPTLPRTDAERLSAFLKKKGVTPELKTKAASVGIPTEVWDYYGN